MEDSYTERAGQTMSDQEKYSSDWIFECKKGDWVVFAYPQGGLQGEIDYAAKLLKIGEAYQVTYVDIGQSRSSVHLKNFPDGFNSTLFMTWTQWAEKQTSDHPENHPISI